MVVAEMVVAFLFDVFPNVALLDATEKKRLKLEGNVKTSLSVFPISNLTDQQFPDAMLKYPTKALLSLRNFSSIPRKTALNKLFWIKLGSFLVSF